jgi:hypothetical protein
METIAKKMGWREPPHLSAPPLLGDLKSVVEAVAQRSDLVVSRSYLGGLACDDLSELSGEGVVIEGILVLLDGVVFAGLGSRKDSVRVIAGQCVSQADPAAVHGCGHGTVFFDYLTEVRLAVISQLGGKTLPLIGELIGSPCDIGIAFTSQFFGNLAKTLLPVLESLDEVFDT